MTTSDKQVWLVTGANRGIGHQLALQIASRPNTIVFAGVRSPSKATELQQFAQDHKNLHIIKLESTSEEDAKNAAARIEATTGGLDVVVANAAIAQNWQLAGEVSIESLKQHFEVNVVGVIILFKAMFPLLQNRQTKKFVTISSLAGQLHGLMPVPMTVYGSSKAGLNYITRSMHKDYHEKGLIAFPIHPGMVDTDMSKSALDVFGMEKFPVTPDDSASMMIKVIDNAGPGEAGRFWSYTGEELEW